LSSDADISFKEIFILQKHKTVFSHVAFPIPIKVSITVHIKKPNDIA